MQSLTLVTFMVSENIGMFKVLDQAGPPTSRPAQHWSSHRLALSRDSEITSGQSIKLLTVTAALSKQYCALTLRISRPVNWRQKQWCQLVPIFLIFLILLSADVKTVLWSGLKNCNVNWRQNSFVKWCQTLYCQLTSKQFCQMASKTVR